jgi:glycosyltransferase involved in cell wall biosynthesis
MGLGILVLAYNAEDTIGSVLTRIPEETYKKAKGVYVFDDASGDATVRVAETFKKNHKFGKKIHIFSHSKNLGYGGNQKYSYQFASKEGLDTVVMLHGDGQYAPELLPQVYNPILKGKADLVFGSRMKGNPLRGKMPLYKFFGNKVLTAIQNIIVGSNFSEFHSGYRAFRTSCLNSLPLEKCTNGFHFDTQILILFFDRNFKIIETSIPTYYGEEVSNVSSIPYGLNVLNESMKYRISKMDGKKGMYWS